MVPDELRSYSDHELTILLHERVQRLTDLVERLERRVTDLTAAQGGQRAIWDVVRDFLPWVLTSASIYVAGHVAHLW